MKYVQTESLIQNHFRSMTLAYPGAVFDKEREFFPFRPPFTLNTPRGVQSIWSPVVVLVQTPLVALTGGFGGLIALSLACGLAILWLTVRLGGRTDDWALPVALGFGTCLWYYAVEPWEHVPAVAAIIGSLWLATAPGTRNQGPRTVQVLVASLLFGSGVVLRYETLLLAPMLLLVVWRRHRRPAALVVACAGVAAVVVGAAMLDFFVYGRPPAAHLLQVVGVLRSVFKTSFPGQPAVASMDVAGRYDTVVHYWVTNSLDRWVVLTFVGAAVAAAALARWARSSAAVLVLALVTLAWSSYQLWLLVPAPRSVPGLINLSPFLVFALFAAPGTRNQEPGTSRAFLLAGCTIAIVLAILTTDTAGGKSLGPRMLLGLVPLLAIAAWQGIAGYLRAGEQPGNVIARAIGWTGLLLVLVSIGINVCALRAWAERFEQERQSIEAVRQSPVRIVVADDPFTAQSFMPLYFRKVLLLAENPAAARDAAAMLEREHVGVVMLVSREERPKVSLEPYRLLSSRSVGRVTLQEWIR